jgi:hypothetical protein
MRTLVWLKSLFVAAFFSCMVSEYVNGQPIVPGL